MVEDPISPANEQIWQPTEKEKVAMLTGTDRIMNNVKAQYTSIQRTHGQYAGVWDKSRLADQRGKDDIQS